MAEDTVAILRQEAARDPHNRDLSDLVGELSTKSEKFRTMWAAQNVSSTAPERNRSTTPSSATSSSPSRRCSSPATKASRSSPTPPNRAPPAHDALNLLATWAATLRNEARLNTVDLPADHTAS